MVSTDDACAVQIDCHQSVSWAGEEVDREATVYQRSSVSPATEGPWPVTGIWNGPQPMRTDSRDHWRRERDFPKPRGVKVLAVLLTEEERALAVRYLPLARHLARRLYETSPTRPEDLHATACMALAEAARNYDPSRKVGFGTLCASPHSGGSPRFSATVFPSAPRERSPG